MDSKHIVFTSALILAGISVNQKKAHADVIQSNQSIVNQTQVVQHVGINSVNQSAMNNEQHVQSTLSSVQSTVGIHHVDNQQNSINANSASIGNQKQTQSTQSVQNQVINHAGTTQSTQNNVVNHVRTTQSVQNQVVNHVRTSQDIQNQVNNHVVSTQSIPHQVNNQQNTHEVVPSQNVQSEVNKLQAQTNAVNHEAQVVNAQANAMISKENNIRIANMIKNSHDNPSGMTPSQVQQQESQDHSNHTMGSWLPKDTKHGYATGTPYLVIGNDPGRPVADTIDVSSYQGNLSVADYEMLKSRGIKNIVVKTSQFSNYVNPDFHDQYNNAKAAGLNVAVYHYAGFANPAQAIQEADYWANVCKQLGVPNDTVLCLDLEDRYTMNSQVPESVRSFWNELDKDGYHKHVLYTYSSYPYFNQVVNTIGADHTWVAAYPYDPEENNQWFKNYGSWQFSDNGHCPGINVTFDLSNTRNDLFSSQSSQTTQSQDYAQNGTFTAGTTLNVRSEDNTSSRIIGQLHDGQTVDYDHVYINDGYAWCHCNYDNQSAYVAMGVMGGESYGTRQVSTVHQVYENNHWYLENAQNQKLSGFQRIPDQNKTCYYDPDNGDAMVYGEKYINGYWYLFDKNSGAMQTGWQHLSYPDGESKDVWYNSEGQMAHGLAMVKPNVYCYFDERSGALQRDKLITVNGNTYYFGSDGGDITNQFKWLPVEHGQYGMAYFDENGHMFKNGQKYIEGHWYLFDDCGAYKTGFQRIPDQNKTCYYDPSNGQMQYGEVDVNGHGYLLDQGSGALHVGQTGWIDNNGYLYYLINDQGEVALNNRTIDGKDYQFDGWGKVLLTGQQYLGNHWYNFDNGHRLLTGFQRLPQGTCYYDPNTGYMLYGNQTIDGKQYYFQPGDGHLVQNQDYAQNGSVTFYYTVNVRTAPRTDAEVVGQLHEGDIIYYDHIYINDGYVWAHYVNYSGENVYVAIGVMNGQSFGDRRH